VLRQQRLLRSGLGLAALTLLVLVLTVSNLPSGLGASSASGHHHPTTTTTTTTIPLGTAASSCSPVGWKATTNSRVDKGITLSNKHCRVMVIGDSLGADLGWGIAREVEGERHIKLIEEGHSDTGLSNPWYYNWPARLPKILRQEHPAIVVIFMGGNDERPIPYHGQNVEFGSEPWRKAYGQIVTRIADEIVAAHASAMWVGMPIMGPNGYRQGMTVINRVDQHAVDQIPGAIFVPTWDYFAGPQGGFHAVELVNGHREVLRSPDGIHFTTVGEDVLATYVVNHLRSVFGLNDQATSPDVLTN
jgi:hypothetical protein